MSRDVAVAEAAVVQARHGVVDVEAVLRLAGRLHVPADELEPERLGQVLGEQRLAGARLAAHQQRPLERERHVHGLAQLVGRDVPAVP